MRHFKWSKWCSLMYNVSHCRARRFVADVSVGETAVLSVCLFGDKIFSLNFKY